MAAVAVLCTLAVLLPDRSTCGTTMIGVVGGGPDTVNSVSCHGYFAQQLGRLMVFEGGEPVLMQRLYVQATAASAAVVVAFLVVARMARHTPMGAHAVALVCAAMITVTSVGLLWIEHGWFMNLDATVTDH